MLTEEGAKLIEFNVRFGDPECQVLLPRLKSDLLPALQAACDGELRDFDLRWNDQAAVAVVMAARGYPDAPRARFGDQRAGSGRGVPGVSVFHAGTEAGPGRYDPGGRRTGADDLRHRHRMCRRRGRWPMRAWMPSSGPRVSAAATSARGRSERHRGSQRGDRIAKWLSRAGVASRRDAERMLAEGAIRLNGKTVTHPATFIAAGDVVQVNGKVVDQPDRTRVWRYHKPEGLVTTHKDPEGRPTVFEKLKHQLPRVISVGRLDLTSEGLLLLTNDGGLARQLELPSTGWLRRYRVRVFGVPNEGALKSLAHGVTVEGVRYGPIEAAHRCQEGRQYLADGQPARGAQPGNPPGHGASRAWRCRG